MAEIDLNDAKENKAAGIAATKKAGVYKGRKPRTLNARPERARELQANGMRPGEIIKALGIKSRSTLSRYLSSEVLPTDRKCIDGQTAPPDRIADSHTAARELEGL